MNNLKEDQKDLMEPNNRKIESESAEQVVAEEASKVGLRGVSTWRGPLPPQVIEKISPEVADEMVRSLCRRQERQDDIVEKLIESKRTSDKEDKIIRVSLTIFAAVLFVLIVLICFYFKDTDLLFKLIEIVITLIGGGGIFVVFFQKKSSTEDRLPTIEFE